MPLPEALIIGAARAGTTSLFEMLTEHPEIGSPIDTQKSLGHKYSKEIHFFDLPEEKWKIHRVEQDKDWYRNLFPENKLGIEGSPSYIFFPPSASRIKEFLPECKFILLLRNPIDRAYSHYLFLLRRGDEHLEFEEALINEESRIGESHQAYLNYSYVLRGKYAQQLKNWFKHFDSKQVLILESEKYFKTPGEAYERILVFLGLQNHVSSYTYRPTWPHVSSVKYTPLSEEIRLSLEGIFRESNEELFQLIGKRLWI